MPSVGGLSCGSQFSLIVGKTTLRTARVILVMAAIMATISSQALAERTIKGVVVKVDGISGIMSVREMHSGTAGAISYGMVDLLHF
jgi:hypothetical protein